MGQDVVLVIVQPVRSASADVRYIGRLLLIDDAASGHSVATLVFH